MMPGTAPVDVYPRHTASRWLFSRWVTIAARVENGEQRRCRHLAHDGPGLVVLWDDAVTRCVECAHRAIVTGDADRRCDRCGRLANSIDAAIWAPEPGIFIGFGLCGPCSVLEIRR